MNRLSTGIVMFRLGLATGLFGLIGCASGAGSASSETSLYYQVWGDGPPVVFVHGFSQTHRAWLPIPVFNDLRTDHKLIAVDLRGHGQSAKPHEPEAYGQNMVDDLVRVLDRLGLERAHFVGFSLGASIVGGLLVSYPDRVLTATLGSGFFTNWDDEEEQFARYTESRQGSSQRVPWEPENQDYLALAAVVRGARLATVSDDEVSQISTPTLIVFGSREIEHLAPEHKRRLERLPSSVKLLIIQGADHDSSAAAVLSNEFSEAVRELIGSNP